MYLSKLVRRQLSVFSVVAVVAGGTMAIGYLDLPKALFGIGHYQVTVNLPSSGGLYKDGNVTYRGVEVGRVEDVRLNGGGVDAVLSLKSDTKIPANVDANVHSQTAVGELFIELVPRSGDGPKLKDGDVIPADHATLPPDINTLLAQTNAGLQAIPHGDLKTVIDESYTAIGGLGPELARIVKGATTLAADARANLDSLTTVIDQSKPVLDSQINSSDSIRAWAANVAEVTRQLQEQDPALKGVLDRGPAATTEARQLIDRLKPTLPVVLANLVNLEQVAVTYQPSLEQILVLFPKDIEMLQAAQLANRDTKQDYKGLFLSFNLNANLPPPCTTGFLPAQQVRSPSEVDYPERPAGDMYCRVPQDSALDVRGARNAPCITRPGKRAPTVKLCESDEDYVPLNDGYNWKGDPNATLSGQSVPQQPPGTPPPAGPPAPPPIAVAQYDPATGTYTGPDGKQYTQTDLARDGRPRAWQDLLIPRGGD
ncbi:virulence factor Mce family protein [Mycobacteroides abscessus subsp. abscessus]|uniref:Virulence factor Mce family protein n=13 Tax=Mycobacteriaceae TaxID=1762 RepID=A0AB38CWE5_9MYCO|nr:MULTISPECIES: MlaD family protein [Mycobacteriaceae]MBI2699573.1 MCE family protein [Mycobacterium sp.]MEE3066762.1 MlaD family protein [Actinomycetota bacterium]AGZ54591.1 mammalian cell entry protein [Mycobacterium kansasii ATCC 12478]AMU54627.1 mammalian cell entry protein [Mycobacteroides abscessus]APT09438.1 mammalian cell entry protein [Mycobacterium avium subsp. hominissuis]